MKLMSSQNIGGGGRHSRLLSLLTLIALLFTFSCRNQTTPQSDNPNTPQKDEITITVAGDGSVTVDATPTFNVPKNSKWKDVKITANKKVTYKDGFEADKWHILNKDGEVLEDEKVFSENTTVFATSKDKPTPEAIRWQFVACGDGSTYAIRNDGSLWVCGWNDDKQLGLGLNIQNDMLSTLTRVGTDTDWKYANAGQGYVFLIKTDGSMWAIGLADKGVQGTNATLSNKVPTRIGTDTDWKTVTTSKFFAQNGFAIKNNGEIWGWGNNLYKTIPGQTKQVITTPQKLALEGKWKDISTGENQVLAIKEDGTLWGWGSNQRKALGIKGSKGIVKTPTQIGTDTDWVKVKCITSRSYAIKSDGSLWACGDNANNMVGLNQPADSIDNFVEEFTKITMLTQGKVIDVSGCLNSTIVSIGENEEITGVYAWGFNIDGALGDGNGKLFTGPLTGFPFHSTPIKVNLPENLKYSIVSSGVAYSLALTREGKLYGWGRNKGGQLGDKTDVDQLKTSFYKLPIEIECPKN